jgi:RND family efflux transporter MFP subunit
MAVERPSDRRRPLAAAALIALGLLVADPAGAADAPAAPETSPTDPLRDIGHPTANWSDIRVQVVAHTHATISAPMTGQIAEFPLRDGDRFQQGQLLARFACAEQESTLAHAKAELEEKRVVLDAKSRLKDLGSGGGVEYRVAQVQEQEAAADLGTAVALVDKCTVKAPFAGRVGAVAAADHEFANLGAPLLEILGDQPLDLELIVPSRWLVWLKPGTGFTVALDETGHTYAARITQLSGKVDAVSQSIKVYGKLTDPATDLLPGMSGHAELTPPSQ